MLQRKDEEGQVEIRRESGAEVKEREIAKEGRYKWKRRDWEKHESREGERLRSEPETDELMLETTGGTCF